MNLRNKIDNCENFSLHFSELFISRDESKPFVLRNKLWDKTPKIISTEFTYKLDIEIEIFNLLSEKDFNDNNILEIDEFSDYSKHNFKKSVYIVFKNKPDTIKFQEKIKEVIKKNIPFCKIKTFMELVEEDIRREVEG